MPAKNRKFLFLPVALLMVLGGCQATLQERRAAPEPEQPPSAGSESQPQSTPYFPSSPGTMLGGEPRVPEGELMAVAEVDDVWERMRRGFRLTVPDNRRVESEIQWYESHQRYFDRVQQRARPYLHFIVEEVEKRDMPGELALLPMVESAFRPTARSPRRATGIWQFMPSTGKMYGLKQTWWYDGRRDVVAATHAALDYLQYLAGRFDGDWELALAAYNAGAAKVKRAIGRNEKAGKPTDFWSLKLPRETRSYVPRLLATAKVIGNPGKYGVALDSIPNQPYFGLVDIEAQMDLTLAADMADISFEELRQLNPGFNRWATDPLGPHQLSLPTDKIPGFMEALSRLDPDQRVQWKRYRIKRGDSLSVIARRHQTTVGVIKQANKLKSSRIRAGRYLLIPTASRENTRYAAGSTTVSPQSGPQGASRIDHTVRNGDNLWTLARNYRVSHRSLAKWNGISTKDTIYPGQKLVIWSENPDSGF